MRQTCSVENCDRPHKARGWCRQHYQRWQVTGEPEGLRRTPNGVPRAWLEQNTNYQGDDCLIWPFGRYQAGYAQLENQNAHRIMCAAVYGAPPTRTHEAAHSCGSGHLGCVNPRHLRWATRVENKADMKLHGTRPEGERHYAAKLSAHEVEEIRALAPSLSQTKIARRYGVSRSNVSAITRNETWKSEALPAGI